MIEITLVGFMLLVWAAASVAIWREAEGKERVWVAVILAITWAILLPIMLDTLKMIALL